MRLEGKVAAIVGAGQSPGEGIGNGRATTLRFAQEGARILAADRLIDSAEETAAMAAKEGGECVPFAADVTKEDTLAAAIAAAEARWGRIDILHNNVGVSIAGGDKPLDEITEEAFDRICAINLRGTIMACKHVVPIMRRQRSGAIINISSVAARENSYPLVAYKATKAAMVAFTEQLALHNAPYGIRANCILPGLMDTPMAVDTRARAQQPQSRRGRRRTRRQGTAARAHGDCLGRRQRRPVPGVGRGQFHNRRGAARRWRLACARRLNRCCTMDGKISVEEAIMANRINRAIELLAGDQAIYYVGGHSGHVLTRAQGREDADTWADYINIGMEHGSFDMAGLAEYMRGLIEGGPTRSGHRTPTVIVEAPVNGSDAANVRFNAWQFRQILGRGVHGVLLCQAESADAVRAFVESCRYPHQSTGIDPTLPSAVERMHGATRAINAAGGSLGLGTRGRGSEATAAAVWGIAPEEYFACCDPWPLNPEGELLLGVKLESPEGIANSEEIIAVPGLGFAELGPGDLGLALGYLEVPRDPYPPEMREARERVFAACRKHRVAFLETAAPESIAGKLDEGVRVIAGHLKETAILGRAHQKRTMPV